MSKKEKVNKLRKISVWPPLVGVVFLVIVFSAIIIIAVQIMLEFTVSSKLANFAEMIEQRAEHELAIVSDMGLTQDFLENVEDVGQNKDDDLLGIILTDKAGRILLSKGESDPDFNSFEDVNLFDKTYRLEITDALESLFYIDDENVSFRMSKFIFDGDYIRTVFERKEFMTVAGLNEKCVEVKVWYEYSNDKYNIYYCTRLELTGLEIFSSLISIIITFIAGCLFILYQLIAVCRILIVRGKISAAMSTDEVTGGKNWTAFTRFAKSKRLFAKKREYALVVFSVYKYDKYCLAYGVEKGEELLLTVYRSLLANTRKLECVCRKEGEEFALLLLDDEILALNGRIYGIISEICLKYPKIKSRFIAGGIRIDNFDSSKMGDYYNCAILAMKTLEKNSDMCVAWFDDAMRKEMLWEQRVESEMQRALENHEFVMYLQPKFSTKYECVGGAEALVRWIHPELGIIPPGRFIPIFENNGFIVQLDDYMLIELVKTQKKWMDEGKKLFPISVNISRIHFSMENLAEHICDIVDTYGVPHKYIELELTESAFFDDKDMMLKTIEKLKYAGFPISMDDFGAGYSSLNTLKELPLDVIKLDAEFFRGEDNFDRAHLIISETIQLAKRLEMHIVAEGIETREQVDYLKSEKCDLIQGYYFAKPMAVEQFVELAYQRQ